MGALERLLQVTTTAALALVPEWGGAAAVVHSAIWDTIRDRLQGYSDAVASGLTDEQLEDFENLIAHDERLQDLLRDGVQAASRTRDPLQRQMLGRILAGAVQHPETVDRLEVIQQSVAELLPAHGRVLKLFADLPAETIHLSSIWEKEPDLAQVLTELIARLERTGIIHEAVVDGGDVSGLGEPGYRLTGFGDLIVEYAKTPPQL